MTSINRAVLITGANGGVGRALVDHFVAGGWRVFAGVRSLASADAAVQGRAAVTAVRIDLTDAAGLADTHREVAEQLRREGLTGLAGLINNAGKSVDGPLELTPVDELAESFAVNVVGTVAVTQAFLPLLRPAHGRIVNMGGAAGRVAMPMYGALSASKAALDSVSDVLRMELLRQGIRVSYIEPGALQTTFFERSAEARARNGYAGSADSQAIYAAAMERSTKAMSTMKPGPLQPVVKAVEHALTAKRPAPRYVVGRDAKLITGVVRRLPTRTRDKAILRTMDLPAAAFVPA
ncbi:MAG TPA: SDR family NAD(P)-dependent oxidoreductase [Jatrophihabitantaceae bacterium]|jgi:NAD(P)-dependent dehydrogenase (short-subunit alcohol dehydrogenase family)|nr:SDR family NAD(P)-dependent oxidoreductase [Jatrophihabitantaceae bacterium]